MSRFSAAFHAHVYYQSETRELASAFRDQLISSDLPVRVSRMVDRPIGPHPTPMFEVDFEEVAFSDVTQWLMFHHGELSILIHPNTDDEWKDHFLHSLWIGRQLTLDEKIFRT